MPFISDAYYQALSPSKQDELPKTHLPLGYHPENYDRLFVPDVDRYAGTYLLGVQGCLHPDTPIFDPVDSTTLTVFERYARGKPFNVLALDGQNVVIAKAEAPLRYTKAPMYELNNGVHSIKVTGQHRVWDGSRYIECCLLYRSQGASGVPLPTIADSDLSRLQRDARRSMKINAGSQGDYRLSHRLCDPLLHPALDTDPVSFPLLSGVHASCSDNSGMDGQGHIPTRSHQHRLSDHLSRSSCVFRVAPEGDGVSQPGQDTLQSACGGFPCADLSPAVKGPDGREPSIELLVVESMSYPYCPLSLYSNNSLYRITRIEDEVYYDFHVPKYESYYACGLFHHNTGKSGLLENMIIQDVDAGNAVIVIDPHGDLITKTLACLPDNRKSSTYLLDMEIENYPFGVNVFATGKLDTSFKHTQAVERIMHIFEVLWPEVLSQQYLPRYVRAATITLLANPGATLVDMHTFLVSDQFRARLLANVTDQSVLQFWQAQYDDLSTSERYRRVQPLIGRLESLFMGRSLVRNIVGQRVTTINFRQAIENKEVIFIRLPIKTVAQDARLIGTMLMSQIHAAVFSFADVPESKRPGVSLYIDEFQNFSTSDIAELFTEGRKFGAKLTVAHQYRNQLPPFLRDSTMTARTKICFQVTPEDGREMAHVFPAQEDTLKVEDIEAHPVQYLLTYGSDNPVIKTFIETYLRPLQGQKRGNRVEMDHYDFDWVKGERKDKTRESDPTPYLDNLLYQVMRTGNADPSIPPEAVIGFANCGRRFYSNVRGMSSGNWLLSPSVVFPPALVVKVAPGELR